MNHMTTENKCFCGHDCAKCVTYIATQTGDDALQKQSQRFYKELIGREFPLEKFNCQGGRSDNIFELCLECPFRKCCVKRNYGSCEECPGYPCHMLADYRARHVNRSNQIRDGITLVSPTIAHKEQALEMVAEFEEYGSPINGDGFLSDFLRDATYEAWVEQLQTASDATTCAVGHAPALTYFGIRESDGRIVGVIDLRLELNDHLRIHGGHIGYAVRPTEQGKHYATEMLKAALKIYKERSVSELLLICSKDNTASAKAITNCGGVLKDEIYSDTYQELLQRYTIHLE